MKVILYLVVAIAVSGQLMQAAPESQELAVSNYREWSDYIRPSANEDEWRKIAWRNKFMRAVEEAKKLDRPVLLWAMNGNPCGET